MNKNYGILHDDILAVQNKKILLQNFYQEQQKECLHFIQNYLEKTDQIKPILLILLLNMFKDNSEPHNNIIETVIDKLPSEELTCSKKFNSPLYTVCIKGYIPLIIKMLQKNIEINCIDSVAKEHPVCPLILSKKISHENKEKVLKIFIEKGLNIYQLDEVNSSLLHLCSKSEDVLLTEKMLPFQSNHEVLDKLQNTFVDYMAHYAKFEDFIKFADLIKNPLPEKNYVHSLAVMGRKRILEYYSDNENLFASEHSINNPNEKLAGYFREKRKFELNAQ